MIKCSWCRWPTFIGCVGCVDRADFPSGQTHFQLWRISELSSQFSTHSCWIGWKLAECRDTLILSTNLFSSSSFICHRSEVWNCLALFTLANSLNLLKTEWERNDKKEHTRALAFSSSTSREWHTHKHTRIREEMWVRARSHTSKHISKARMKMLCVRQHFTSRRQAIIRQKLFFDCMQKLLKFVPFFALSLSLSFSFFWLKFFCSTSSKTNAKTNRVDFRSWFVCRSVTCYYSA